MSNTLSGSGQAGSQPRAIARAIRAMLVLGLAVCIEGEMQAASAAGVKIYRDQWGAPYVYADTEEQGFYGLGYVTAADRGERFLQLVLWGTGQWAQAKGNEITPLGAPAVILDQEAAKWRHTEESKRAYDRLDPRIKRNFEHFTAGFNRYYEDNRGARPSWAPVLEPWQYIAVVRGVFWPFSMISDGMADCRRGGVQLTSADLNGPERQFASNAWVLLPAKTRGGKTILLSDPHGPVDGGLIFTEVNVSAGALKASGFAIGPVFITAQTDTLAWGATAGQPDLSDCYAIEWDGKSRYKVDGGWHEMKSTSYSIPVKDGGAHSFDVTYIEHNGVSAPVVGRDDRNLYIVSTPYMHEGASGVEQLYKLLFAHSVDEVLDVIEDPRIFGQNFMFADRRGNSLFVRLGRTPVRPQGFDWSRPVPGSSATSAWKGVHAVTDLVWVKNPVQGYMKNGNEAPDQIVRGESPIRRTDYPDYIFNDPGFTTARSFRMGELLHDAKDVTIAAAVAIAFDEMLPHTRRWQKALALAMEVLPDKAGALDAQQKDFLDRIQSFDGIAAQESRMATAYVYWREAVQAHLALPAAGKIMGTDPREDVSSISPETAVALLQGVIDASAAMVAAHGTLDVPLGDLFRIGRGENDWPLGGVSVCLSPGGAGCEETLRAFTMRGPAQPDGTRRPLYGSRMLRLVAFGDQVEAFSAFNYGQSDDPASTHFDDQARELFSKRQVKRIYQSEKALRRSGASLTRLRVPPVNREAEREQ